MATILTTNTPKAMWPGIQEWWGTSYNDWEKEYVHLYEVVTSTKNYEEDVQVIGLGLAPELSENDPIAYDTVMQGYTTRYTPKLFGLAFSISKVAQADNLYMEQVLPKTRNLARTMNKTREYIAALPYNRAFDGTYTFGDGVALCVTTHPTMAGNQSNVLNPAADFSQAALEDLLIQIADMEDDRGIKIHAKPLSLHGPSALLYEFQRVLKSDLQSNTAENALNVVKGTFPRGWFINHEFDDTDAWFIRTDVTPGMKAVNRQDPEFEDDGDFETGARKYKSTMRVAFGCSDWRGIVGSPGA